MNGSLQRSFLCGILGFIAALFFTVLFGPPHSGSWFLATVSGLTVILGAGLHVLARHYDDRLTRRIASNMSQRWDVVLNDVKLGSVTDAEYATIQQRVFRDGRAAGEQFLNVAHVALRVIGRLFVLIPFLLFWTAIAMYLTAPDSVVSVLLEVQQADAAMVAKAAGMLLQWVCVFASSALVIMAASGIDVGVRDCFSAGVHRELRRHFKTPAMGEMRLTLQPVDCACSVA
jgi:hypothetical protein